MQCNTNYTGSVDNFKFINLNVLKLYRTLFPNAILGLSDHTPGHETVLGSIALGAKVIEKHFTDDTNRPGPDHPFSMDPNTWGNMVLSSRRLEASMGSTIKKVEDNEKETLVLQRRAVRAIRDLNIGEKLNREDIEFQRPCPAEAIKPNQFKDFEGKTIKQKVKKGCEIKISDLER